MFEFLIIGIVAYGLWKLFSDNGNTDKASEQQKRENNRSDDYESFSRSI